MHACAVFVGCGVVKDVSRMVRILKLLTTALEQSKGVFISREYFDGVCLLHLLDAGMLSLGETGELSPNASAMLRISTVCLGTTSGFECAPNLPPKGGSTVSINAGVFMGGSSARLRQHQN